MTTQTLPHQLTSRCPGTGNTGRFSKRYSAVSLASSGRSSGCHSKPVMNTSVIESGVDAAAV